MEDLLLSALRLAIPIGFAGLGGLISERSGVYNIGLEGLILLGALSAAVGTQLTGYSIIGFLSAFMVGALFGALLGYLFVLQGVNQLVGGIAFNIFAYGITTFSARALLVNGGRVDCGGCTQYHIPFLSDTPLLGKLIFGNDSLFYALIICTWFARLLLFRTHLGLSLTSCGENPDAAYSAGIDVVHMRFWAVVSSCALSSIGGAYMVLCQVLAFGEDMSTGKGFLALGCIILGRWLPFGVLSAAIFFGICEALELHLQVLYPDLPYQFVAMIPYITSLMALVGLTGQISPPRSIGIYYNFKSR